MKKPISSAPDGRDNRGDNENGSKNEVWGGVDDGSSIQGSGWSVDWVGVGDSRKRTREVSIDKNMSGVNNSSGTSASLAAPYSKKVHLVGRGDFDDLLFDSKETLARME